MNIGEDIERLERGIRRLKIQYDQYFAGALPRQPLELRAELEQIVRKYSNAPIRRLAERFHFNTLVSRFNTFSELWNKQLRAKEEGRSLPGQLLPREDDKEEPGAAAGRPLAASANGTTIVHQQLIVGHPQDGGSDLRLFYDKFLEARRSSGQPVDGISYASFSRQILQKSEAVKTRAACDAVRLRMTLEGDRVQLKAMPVHRRKDG